MGELAMKKISVLLCFLILSFSYAEEVNMNPILKKGMERYFERIIPSFYKGTFNERDEYMSMARECAVYMQGSDGGLDFFMETKQLCFDFYYIVGDHKRQDEQVINVVSKEINNQLYEYWIVKMSDHGTPYNYAYFYLTKTDSLESKREIISISKKYQGSYILENGTIFDLTIPTVELIYAMKPQLKLESFKDTIYENKIVVWRTGKQPYLRNMNFLERLYYKSLKKSQR